MTLGEMARTQILLGDRPGAAESLRRAAELTKRERVVSPWHESSPLVGQLLFDVTALEAAATGDRSRWRALRRAGIRSARRAIGTAAKVAKERIETYRLVGRLWWVLGNRSRAFKWWTKAIAEATRMGARPELARTHCDIGRRIGASVVADADGATHLNHGRRLLIDLDLEWDLRQLEALPPAVPAVEPESAVA
ncbi:MAG TPA: hypothetical protein VMT64_01885, partial [Candidatus Binataceae bacterium]|nr:hypothetical protein [Candidatus Binataceae bacterium]